MRLAWSALAKTELAEIRQHSIDRWGREVAMRYLADLRDAVKSAAAAPEGLRPLKRPFRIRRVRSHYLILHVDPAADRLTVARVLHVRMDIERHLPKSDDDDGDWDGLLEPHRRRAVGTASARRDEGSIDRVARPAPAGAPTPSR